MNIKINKDKIKMLGAFTLVSAYMLGAENYPQNDGY